MRRTPSASPGLTVVNGNWGATWLSGIDGVLRSVDAALTEAFEATPDDSIPVSTWSVNYPRTLNGARPYKVFLTAPDTYWSHHAYQFAHELYHLLTGFDRYQQHKHRWFEESLCELASLFALHRIAETWLENPPAAVVQAVEFASWHRNYAERIQRKGALSNDLLLSDWFRENVGSLEADSNDLAKRSVLAVAMLPKFRTQPTLWRDCGDLNTWDLRGNRTFEEYLDSWETSVMRDDRKPTTPQYMRHFLGLDSTTESSGLDQY